MSYTDPWYRHQDFVMLPCTSVLNSQYSAACGGCWIKLLFSSIEVEVLKALKDMKLTAKRTIKYKSII